MTEPPPGKYARWELERRFLVERLPQGLDDRQSWLITDRYIVDTRLRLRRMNPLHGGETIFKLGQKEVPSPPDFGRMTITNIYLSSKEYAVLAQLRALELRKRRYHLVHNNRPFSIDVFEEDLAGLVLAETAFERSTEMTRPLDVPPWVGAEVTSDVRFTGGALAGLAREAALALIQIQALASSPKD